MSEEYARAIAKVVAAQLAEADGFESVQESAIEILSDLLLRYISELSIGAHSYAELATRSQINVPDVLMSLEDMGTSVEDLRGYMDTPLMKKVSLFFSTNALY
jgi:transcription initiation factor TFIID subunit 8